MLEICGELLHIVENLLEILFNHCQNPGELNISHPWNNIIGDSVILVPDQYGEFDV